MALNSKYEDGFKIKEKHRELEENKQYGWKGISNPIF